MKGLQESLYLLAVWHQTFVTCTRNDTNASESFTTVITDKYLAFQSYTLARINGRRIDRTNYENVDPNDNQMLPLLQFIVDNYMTECDLLSIRHTLFRFDSSKVNFDITTLIRQYGLPMVQAQIKKSKEGIKEILRLPGSHCTNYILFLHDISLLTKIIGSQPLSKVVVITSSSIWKIREYLEGPNAKKIVNILVVATSGPSDIIIRRGEKTREAKFINMYTHDIYTDGLGMTKMRLLTSWKNFQLARNIPLFPRKMPKGFNGRQFEVVASSQPPYVIKKNLFVEDDADKSVLWDGIEIRLLHLIGPYLNFTMLIREAPPPTNVSGAAEVVSDIVGRGLAEIGSAGAHRPQLPSQLISYSMPHSVDCAVFTTRSSFALPRYRAILGPFHWHVWLTLIITYLIAIFPLTFADKHSLQILVDNPWHFETMFWFVFGTFTNLFTFKGTNSWSNSDKHAPRMFVGWYWAFTIIITACYSGSIIAFITLYVYPDGIDTVDQLLAENYRVGTLSTGGWGEKFNNSEHAATKWLLRDIDLVPNVVEGLRNVSKSFYLPLFRPYTLLASRAELEYFIKTNFTLKNKKDVMYVSKDCFAPFGVSLLYPANAPYTNKINEYILRCQQSGLIALIYRQMDWDLLRSSTGQRLQAGGGKSLRDAIIQDRKLALDDTQGMFLLLGSGYLIAAAVLISEVLAHQRALESINRWRPVSSLATKFYELQEYLNSFSRNCEVPSQQIDDGFIYKTYDSRVLNSQHQSIGLAKFASDSLPLRSACHHDLGRTTSLPAIRMVQPMARKSSSCHDIMCRTTPPSLYKVTMRFGSVGSVLQFKHCQSALLNEYYHERPQTSRI